MSFELKLLRDTVYFTDPDFATKTYNLVCIYLVVVFFVVFLACCPAEFNMSDGVLITLLGTTTINVIGLFAIVMNYLFPKK